jgi:hypothetical protein
MVDAKGRGGDNRGSNRDQPRTPGEPRPQAPFLFVRVLFSAGYVPFRRSSLVCLPRTRVQLPGYGFLPAMWHLPNLLSRLALPGNGLEAAISTADTNAHREGDVPC